MEHPSAKVWGAQGQMLEDGGIHLLGGIICHVGP